MGEDNDEKSALVPRLRFPEFRETSGWKTAQLDGLISIVTPPKKIPTTEYLAEGQFPIIDQGQSDIAGWADDPDSLVKENEPLIIFGDHTCALKLALGSFAQGADGIKIFKGNGSATTEFLYQFLFFRPVSPEEYKRHFSILRNKVIAYPEAKSGEQQKIADCLSSLDGLITAETQKLYALKTHKKGLMQQLFPREGETVPRLRFPEFQEAGEWEEQALLHYIASLDAGVSVNSGDRSARDDEIGVLKTSCVSHGNFDATENKVVQDPEEIARVKEPVCANTIIISRMNTIALVGANAFVENDIPNLFLPDRLWAAKSTGRGNMRFLAYVLGSEGGRGALSGLASGSSGTMKNIGKSEVLALQVTAPAAAEQERIADCLSSLDDLITAQSRKINALKTHKKGLMQQLFPVLDEVVQA